MHLPAITPQEQYLNKQFKKESFLFAGEGSTCVCWRVLFPTKHLRNLLFSYKILCQVLRPPQFILPPKAVLQSLSLSLSIESLRFFFERERRWRLLRHIYKKGREMDPCFCLALLFLALCWVFLLQIRCSEGWLPHCHFLFKAYCYFSQPAHNQRSLCNKQFWKSQ